MPSALCRINFSFSLFTSVVCFPLCCILLEGKSSINRLLIEGACSKCMKAYLFIVCALVCFRFSSPCCPNVMPSKAGRNVQHHSNVVVVVVVIVTRQSALAVALCT